MSDENTIREHRVKGDPRDDFIVKYEKSNF